MTTWTFDTVHSNITFSVRHLVISKVRGRFTRWTGALALDGDLPATVTASIEAASIDTNEPQRDGHLRSPDFFDAENHPNLTFTSTRLESADGELRLVGDLTIRGVTREVVLDVEAGGRVKDPWGNERVGFAAKTVINRKEFGLVWNQLLEAGGVAVGEKVEIAIEVEAVRAG